MKTFSLLFVLPLMILVSCKVGCDAEKLVSGSLAPAIGKALQCTNVTQIQTDIDSVLNKTNVCPAQGKQATGPIAMLVCPLIAQGAVSLLGTTVPANWQCNPQLVEQGLATVITTACNLLPF